MDLPALQKHAMKSVIIPGVISHAGTLFRVSIRASEYVENLAHGFVEFLKSKKINSKICVLVILMQGVKLGTYN